MALKIPLRAQPAQQVYVVLNNQACTLNVYQKFFGLFMDVLVNTETGTNLVQAGMLCLNKNRLIRSSYLGFNGDFVWYDAQGTQDPYWSGIGDRYFLLYAGSTELTFTDV